ncbi:pilZ domain protein, partial [Vibrio parahaemolyticus VPTS-2010_2]
IS